MRSCTATFAPEIFPAGKISQPGQICQSYYYSYMRINQNIGANKYGQISNIMLTWTSSGITSSTTSNLFTQMKEGIISTNDKGIRQMSLC